MSMAHERRLRSAPKSAIFRPVDAAVRAVSDLGERRLRDRQHQVAAARSTSATRSPMPRIPAHVPLPRYRKVTPMVYCGLYPNEGADYDDLRDALEKLKLNDAALSFEPEIVGRARLRIPLRLPRAAAHGDRAGAARARLRDLDLIATSPSVVYHVVTTTDGERAVDRQSVEAAAADGDRAASKSRTCNATIITPPDYVGAIMDLTPIAARRDALEHGVSADGRVHLHLRDAADRSDHRLLRSVEVAHQGLCLARLRAHRLSRRRSGEARHPAQRRAGGRAVVHRRIATRRRCAAARWPRSSRS